MAKKSNNNPENKNKTKQILMISAIVLLLGINIFMVYWKFGVDDKKMEQMSTTINEKTDTVRMQSEQITEMEAELEAVKATRDSLGLENATLDSTIAEYEKKISYWKNRAVSYKKRAQAYSQMKRDFNDLKAKLGQTREKMNRLDSLNNALHEENVAQKETIQTQRDSINTVEKKKNKLKEQVDVASKLKVADTKVILRQDNGKVRREEPYKARRIGTLEFNYNIVDNPVAPQETKEIYLRVLDQKGKAIYDLGSGGGSFRADGNNIYYTAKKSFLFDNRSEPEPFKWKPQKDLEEGTYQFEIYVDDYKAGEGKFSIDTGWF